MKISTSILDCKDRIEGVLRLNQTDIDYIHVDVMDGRFVSNTQFYNVDEIKKIQKVSKYSLDVHLMVEDVLSFVNQLREMNIEIITFHLEMVQNIETIISLIRKFGYKVGIALKPGTDLEKVRPYLADIDMVLLMSVEPGLGGQSFLKETAERIAYLKSMIKEDHRSVLIEIDGGINKQTIEFVRDSDIVVVGSFIVSSENYEERIQMLKG